MSKAPFNYQAEADVTASGHFHGEKVPFIYMLGVLKNCIANLKELDNIKKTLFYGRPIEVPEVFKAPSELIMNSISAGLRVDEDQTRGERLLHGIVGKATESGELLEMLLAVLEGKEAIDSFHLIEEVGDGLWYDALILNSVGSTFETAMLANIRKLRHRFPNAFTEYDANNRDLLGERVSMTAAEIETEIKRGLFTK